MKEQQDHGKDRAQLDYDLKHVVEFLGNLQVDEFIQKDHVSGGRNGQPFRDALNDAEEDGFQ